MPEAVYIEKNKVVDSDDVTATVLVNSSTTKTPLIFNKNNSNNLRMRTGQKARLVFIGNAVDPGGETSVTFHLYINGNLAPPPYDSFQQALGVTFDPQSSLSVPIEIPQNAFVQIVADNSSTTTNYNVFARLRFEYESLN